MWLAHLRLFCIRELFVISIQVSAVTVSMVKSVNLHCYQIVVSLHLQRPRHRMLDVLGKDCRIGTARCATSAE